MYSDCCLPIADHGLEFEADRRSLERFPYTIQTLLEIGREQLKRKLAAPVCIETERECQE
jgi:hypothetical protein